MFKPNKQLKKALAKYDSCAYIFKDGIVLWEHDRIPVKGGDPINVDIYHIVPLDIRIYATDYGKEYESGEHTPEIKRVVVTNCHLIANGFESIEVKLNHNSRMRKDHNLIMNTVRFTNGDHQWEATSIANVTSVGVTVQPNPYNDYNYGNVEDTIRTYLRYQNTTGCSVILHGDLPALPVDVPAVVNQ